MSLSFWTASLSSRRSIFVPQRMKGTPGAWWLISVNHFFFKLSKDEGDMTE